MDDRSISYTSYIEPLLLNSPSIPFSFLQSSLYYFFHSIYQQYISLGIRSV